MTLRYDRYDPARVEVPPPLMRAIKIRQYEHLSGYTIWVVDGSVIRDHIDIEFALGGNPGRYAYVPQDEVWIEDTGDEPDMDAIAAHETVESDLMIKDGFSYEEAHTQASKIETDLRRRVVL